jgi:hypothetical protein
MGTEYAGMYSMEPLPKTAYKIVEQNGCLRSVYVPTMVYPINEWVTDPAKPEHEGGIYCYLDGNQAINAAHAGDVFNSAWANGKTLVLCECEVKGRKIEYGTGKIAYSNLKITKVLREVVHN